MSYILPPNASIIWEQDRTDDDHYIFNSGGQHSHHFKMIEKTKLQIVLTHTHPFYQSQDNSIVCWFSIEPIGLPLFHRPPLDRFFLKRQSIDYFANIDLSNIANSTFTDYTPVVLNFDSSLLKEGSYFLNVQNLQNRENSYDCNFTYV